MYKATEDVKRYIWGIKQKDPLKSALDISILVEKRYHKNLSERHIRNILEEIGLNDLIGRKADKQKIKKKRVIKNIVALFGFILSAASAIKGEEAILKVVMIKRDIRLDGTRICTHKTSTLLRYIRTLFLLPAFDMERPIAIVLSITPIYIIITMI